MHQDQSAGPDAQNGGIAPAVLHAPWGDNEKSAASQHHVLNAVIIVWP